MLINLFVSFSILIFTVCGFQETSAQINESPDSKYSSEEPKWIRNDIKTADVVAYVDAKEIKLIDSLGNADCENNKGTGYCQYLITAEVKEFFKGNTHQNKIEFYVSPDASFPKKVLLGEQVVFLVSSKNNQTNGQVLNTIENSTRDIEVLGAIRKIIDPNASVDDSDELNPYSLISLKKAFDDAYAVLLVDAQSFSKTDDNLSPEGFIIYAHVKEVFKGNFEIEQKLWYRDDFLYRPFRKEDLGRQIVFIEKNRTSGEVFYTKIRYTADKVQNNVLEKLKKISSGQ